MAGYMSFRGCFANTTRFGAWIKCCLFNTLSNFFWGGQSRQFATIRGGWKTIFFLAWLQIPTIHFLDSWVNRLILPFGSWFLSWWILPNHERIGVIGESFLKFWLFIHYPMGDAGFGRWSLFCPKTKIGWCFGTPKTIGPKISLFQAKIVECVGFWIPCISFRIDGTNNPRNKLHRESKGTPSMPFPCKKWGLIQDLLITRLSLDQALLGSYFFGWMALGVGYPLDSHDKIQHL